MRSFRCGGPVFAALQFPDGTFHRWVTIAEAERLKRRGDCKKLSLPGRKGMGPTRPTYRLVPRPEPSASQETMPALSAFDVLANVGLAGSAADQREARLRVRNYQGIANGHDPKFYQLQQA